MKCSLSEQAYKWHDGEQWHVGKMVREHDGRKITVIGTRLLPQDDDLILVAHSHTHELEFVRYGDLSIYPESPIQEPTK